MYYFEHLFYKKKIVIINIFKKYVYVILNNEILHF